MFLSDGVKQFIVQRYLLGTLTLSPERQSGRMSKITKIINDGLSRSGTGCFMAVYPYGDSGHQRVKLPVLQIRLYRQVVQGGSQSAASPIHNIYITEQRIKSVLPSSQPSALSEEPLLSGDGKTRYDSSQMEVDLVHTGDKIDFDSVASRVDKIYRRGRFCRVQLNRPSRSRF